VARGEINNYLELSSYSEIKYSLS